MPWNSEHQVGSPAIFAAITVRPAHSIWKTKAAKYTGLARRCLVHLGSSVFRAEAQFICAQNHSANPAARVRTILINMPRSDSETARGAFSSWLMCTSAQRAKRILRESAGPANGIGQGYPGNKFQMITRATISSIARMVRRPIRFTLRPRSRTPRPPGRAP